MQIRYLLTLLMVVVGMQIGVSENMSAIAGFDPITFSVDSGSGMEGDIVCVDFNVNNFDRVEGMQFSVNYNPNVLSIICSPDVSNSPLDQTELFFNCTEDDGRIRTFWTDPNSVEGDGVSVPDGDLIFTLCFELVGDCGESSPVTISSIPLDIEVNQISTDGISCENEVVIVEAGLIEIECSDLTINTSKCDASLAGDDGSLSFFIAGGSGSYTYSISPSGQSGSAGESEIIKIEPLLPGNYTITVTDVNTGAMVMENVFISDNFPLELELTATDPYCFNNDKGHIETIVTRGGIAESVTYAWSNFQFTENIEDLSSGTYSVTVSDFFGCTATSSVTLFVDTLRVFAEVLDSASCEGNNDAVVKIWAEGGTPFTGGANPEYNYETSGTDGGPIDTLILDNVSTGAFTYYAIDAAVPYCGTDEVTIDIPAKDRDFGLIIDTTNISCFGMVDGMATITATGATNFSIQVRDEQNMLVSGANLPATQILENLPAGCYSVLATDAFDGCEISGSFCIVEPDELMLTEDMVTDPGCVGDDGSILLNTVGGTEPFTYEWSDGPASTEDRTGLVGGIYAVTVTDDMGCTAELDFNLPDGENVQINAVVNQAINCAQDTNGEVEVSISTPGNFVYNWEAPDGTFVSDMAIVTGLGSGTYYVTATDSAANCIALDTVVLAAASPIVIEGNYQEPLCAGIPNGVISIVHIEGTSPFTYLWEDNSTMQVLSGITDGTYAVTITDANMCELDTMLTLNAPEGIQVDVTNIGGVDCFGVSNGQATATATGGPAMSGSYTYFWSNDPSNGVDGATINQSGLPAGENWVIAVDGICASDTIFFEVPDIDSISVDLDLSNIMTPTCYGDCDGSIEVAAIGGNSDSYTYMWLVDGSNSNMINNLCADTYQVQITDANGCVVTRDIELPEPDSLSAEINQSQLQEISCDVVNGQIGISLIGGTSPYTYEWTDDVSDNQIASGLSAGTYVVTVTDFNGCTASTNYTLIAPDPVVAVIAAPEEPNCFGDLTCITIESAVGGVGNDYTFTINNGARFPIDSCVAVFANEYTITVFDSSGLCSYIETINIDQPNEIFVDAGPDQEIDLGESSEDIIPNIDADNDIVDVTWSPADSITCLDVECQDIIVTPLLDQLYTVTVTDENGCTADDDIFIAVNTSRNVYIPNIFTPDGDGVNDFFNIVIGSGAVSVSYLSIFDRWGNLVYSVETEYVPEQIIANGWDGTYKGNFVNPGVYVYTAKVNFIDGKSLEYSGDVTLIR